MEEQIALYKELVKSKNDTIDQLRETNKKLNEDFLQKEKDYRKQIDMMLTTLHETCKKYDLSLSFGPFDKQLNPYSTELEKSKSENKSQEKQKE